MNILPTIVQEAVSQCKRQGFVVSAALASFYVRCQLLTATKDPQNNVELSPEQIERLVTSAVRTLTLNDNPMLETFKLQASITTAQQEQVNTLRTEKVQHKAKSHRIMQNIWSKTDPNEVFSEISMFILHESHLLGDANEANSKETMTALETVFPVSLMDSFISQREHEKVRQLEEIWRIVWGIRIFNRVTGKGGVGVPDLMNQTRSVLQTTVESTAKLIEQAQAAAKEYVAVLSCPSLPLADASRMRLQDEYLNRLQLQVYLKALLLATRTLAQRTEEFLASWETSTTETHALMESAEANPVAKNIIFPRFISLSERWDVLYGLHREATDAAALLDIISGYVSSFKPTIRPADVERAITSMAEDRKPNHDLIAAELKNPAVEYLSDLPGDKKETRLEFNGFCVVSLVDEGTLLEGKRDSPACPGFLLLKTNSAYYSFSSERALKSFAKEPFKYLSQRLMDIVAGNPVLIYLLGLNPYLPKELYLAGSRKHELPKAVERGDAITQTGHIDSYKDTHYVWNEWELRRLALQLAGLRTKRTKASQTHLSHFRRDNDTQIYLPKTQTTQTLVDSAVQPPRMARFVKGLRGTASSETQTVEKVFLY